jgi:hypothetical protein
MVQFLPTTRRLFIAFTAFQFIVQLGSDVWRSQIQSDHKASYGEAEAEALSKEPVPTPALPLQVGSVHGGSRSVVEELPMWLLTCRIYYIVYGLSLAVGFCVYALRYREFYIVSGTFGCAGFGSSSEDSFGGIGGKGSRMALSQITNYKRPFFGAVLIAAVCLGIGVHNIVLVINQQSGYPRMTRSDLLVENCWMLLMVVTVLFLTAIDHLLGRICTPLLVCIHVESGRNSNAVAVAPAPGQTAALGTVVVGEKQSQRLQQRQQQRRLSYSTVMSDWQCMGSWQQSR